MNWFNTYILNPIRKWQNRNDNGIRKLLVNSGLNERLSLAFLDKFTEADKLGNKNGNLDLDEFISLESNFKGQEKTYNFIKDNWDNLTNITKLPDEVSAEINKLNPMGVEHEHKKLFNQEELNTFINNSESLNPEEKAAVSQLFKEYFENKKGFTKNFKGLVSEQEVLNILVAFKALPKEQLNQNHINLQKQLKSIDLEAFDALDGESYNTVIYDLDKVSAIAMENYGYYGHDSSVVQDLVEYNKLNADEVLAIPILLPGLNDKGNYNSAKITSFLHFMKSIADKRDGNNKLIVNISHELLNYPDDGLDGFNKEFNTNLTSFNPNDISDEDRNKINAKLKGVGGAWSGHLKQNDVLNNLANHPNIQKINIATGNEENRINLTSLLVGNNNKINIIGALKPDGKKADYNSKGSEQFYSGVTASDRPFDGHPLAGENYKNHTVNEQELDQIIADVKKMKQELDSLESNADDEVIQEINNKLRNYMSDKVLSQSQAEKFLSAVFENQKIQKLEPATYLRERINLVKNAQIEENEEIYLSFISFTDSNRIIDFATTYYVGEVDILTRKIHGSSHASPKG